MRRYQVRTNTDTRDIPWYQDWVEKAKCRDYPWGWFFNYGRNKKKINRAKWVCNHCQVKRECLRDNMNIPYGIFGGMTWLERWRSQGHTGYPSRHIAYQSFAVRYTVSNGELRLVPNTSHSANRTQKKSSKKSGSNSTS